MSSDTTVSCAGRNENASCEYRGQHAADEIPPGLGGCLHDEQMNQRGAEQRERW